MISQSTPQRRAVMLGASNLARSMSTLVDSACMSWGRPLDLMAALGHGRSFGLNSNVMGRGLPGIDQCELWNDLARRPAMPTAGLITDIGNDILYGAEVSHIVRWVRRCLERLAPRCERLVITGLPETSLQSLGKRRFALFRTVLFPRSKLTLEQAMEKVHQLGDQIVQLAQEFDASLVIPRTHWYGVDPIHIRMRHWKMAWQEILAPWNDGCTTSLASGSLLRWLSLRTTCPRYRTIVGFEQQRLQPARTLHDGTTVSLY